MRTGDVGYQGEEGEKGPTGDKGRQGLAGTITYRHVSPGNDTLFTISWKLDRNNS